VALSPGIPTSFVPRQTQPQGRQPRTRGQNLFLIAALFIGGLAVIAAIGTYLYDRYLLHTVEAKAEELAIAQQSVDQEQVEEFVRLRDRLVYGETLLDNHVAVSKVLDVLEAQTLQTVRYTSLDLAVADDHTAQLEIEGTARNFNSLAAQSNSFASEKGIRRAIFSGIEVNENNTVNFILTAELDSQLLLADVPAPAPAIVPATVPQQPAQPTAPAAATSQPQPAQQLPVTPQQPQRVQQPAPPPPTL
jgi:hypothetical protein